jgi:hypothetical protein
MLSLARFEPSCSVYGRECPLESFGSASAMKMTLAILPGRLAPPVLTMTLADLEAIEARERKPRYNEPMLADDFDHWLARTHHRAGADQDFADNTIDHRSKLGIVIERSQLLQGAVGFL